MYVWTQKCTYAIVHSELTEGLKVMDDHDNKLASSKVYISKINEPQLPWLRTAIYHTGLYVKMEVTQCAGRISANTIILYCMVDTTPGSCT